MGVAEEWFVRFEHEGEDAVKKALALKQYLPNVDSLAEEWLRQKAQARSEAFQAAQAETAQRAADAAQSAASAAERAAVTAREQAEVAREQARFAKAANTRATIAIVIGIISLISSIIIPFLKP